ncbi:MFS transporter [Gordonia sp. HNM0687]|uniref:MFS transporter n=1 Tax=Gordonia mangrovi TaxID=2665643 RepID=A0A6L7GW75_9ACTN|nr:MFS transporter [Gordonia mangrovi]MXP22748.1 MFS transporter [Gordonia mangrovi]UVF77063.1 MFS transporter [Gordonia mangrovi]
MPDQDRSSPPGSGAPDSATPGTWRELFDRGHRAAVTVFAGGIAVFAINTYLTAASLPTAVADIGGQRLYAWVMTVFLITSVFSSMLVTRTLSRWGARGAYVIAFGLFGAGSLVCALSPAMPVMLVGRGLQGLGGGLLTGLSFAVIRVALPERLWVRAVGFASAMWGVGNLIGPLLGGFFAQIGFWRGSFWLLVVASVAMSWFVRALPSRRREARDAAALPWASLGWLVAATVCVSVAGIVDGLRTPLILVAVAVVLSAGFVLVDRHTVVGLLPRLTYTGGNPLKWIYVSIAVLAIGSTAEGFVPLFGQQIAGMAPLVAGMLGAALSWGWSSAQLASTTWANGRRATTVRILGPGLLAAGLAGYGLLQFSSAPAVVAAWFLALFVAGAGIGMAFPHIATAAMTITRDETEAARASAGINTVQMVANTFGSALAGLLVSVGATVGAGTDDPTVTSARFLTFGFAAVAVAGVVAAVASVRPARVSPRRPGRRTDRS